MPQKRQPRTATIRGVFVRSHVDALRDKKGASAVEELGRRFGAPLRFGNLEQVPVRDEVRLIELSLDLMSDHGLQGPERAEAAGALHLRNFSQTTLGATLMSALPHTPKNFLTLMHSSPTIVRSVFSGTGFTCEERQDGVVLTIKHCDYPPEHFAGFFGEWMRVWGLKDSSVRTFARGPGTFEYWLYFAR